MYILYHSVCVCVCVCIYIYTHIYAYVFVYIYLDMYIDIYSPTEQRDNPPAYYNRGTRWVNSPIPQLGIGWTRTVPLKGFGLTRKRGTFARRSRSAKCSQAELAASSWQRSRSTKPNLQPQPSGWRLRLAAGSSPVNPSLRTSRGMCGICDTPELWRGAASLCERVRACAGAAGSLHIHIHTYHISIKKCVYKHT